MVVQAHGAEVKLPHRLFHPFSLELNDKTEYEAVLDFDRRSATHVRGTEQLPAESLLRVHGGGPMKFQDIPVEHVRRAGEEH